MTPEEFRAALKALRLTQGQAAAALDVSPRQISRYAMGQAEIPEVVRLALKGLEVEGVS